MEARPPHRRGGTLPHAHGARPLHAACRLLPVLACTWAYHGPDGAAVDAIPAEPGLERIRAQATELLRRPAGDSVLPAGTPASLVATTCGGPRRKVKKRGVKFAPRVVDGWRQRGLEDTIRMFRSDKASTHKRSHNYVNLYEPFLSAARGTDVRVAEFGVYCGNSLLAWREYLGPRARVWGLDIFGANQTAIYPPSDAGQLPAGIGLVRVSQVDHWGVVAAIDAIQPDIVFEDACHSNAGNVLALNAIFPALKPGAVYAVEDFEPAPRGDPGPRLFRDNPCWDPTRLSARYPGAFDEMRTCADVGLAHYLTQLKRLLDSGRAPPPNLARPACLTNFHAIEPLIERIDAHETASAFVLYKRK